MKAVDSAIRVVGCQPAASDVMRASVAAGRILDQARLQRFRPQRLVKILVNLPTATPC